MQSSQSLAGGAGAVTAAAGAGTGTAGAAVPTTSTRNAQGSDPDRERRGRRLRRIVLFGLLGYICLSGLPYYTLSLGERLRHPLHPFLKPSGYIGQTAGLIAFVLFVFIWLYPLRKKFRWLAFTGPIHRWLDLHILAGLCLPILGAIHASWRFEGLIGLGYAAMLVVCLSGIVGKYLYARIPRSKNGVELNLDEISDRCRSHLTKIAAATGLEPSEVERVLAAAAPRREGRVNPVAAVFRMLADDLVRWRGARRLARRCRDAGGDRRAIDRRTLREVRRLARRQIALTQRVRMLEVSRRIFHYWHVGHRPFAVAALLAVLAHVGLVVALGATWLW